MFLLTISIRAPEIKIEFWRELWIFSLIKQVFKLLLLILKENPILR